MQKTASFILTTLFISIIPMTSFAVSSKNFVYGNFCGAGKTSQAIQPVDALDAICKAHDACCDCGTIFKTTMVLPGSVPNICPKQCGDKLVNQLTYYIKKNCGVTKILKGKHRAKICLVARAGLLYNSATKKFNATEINKCVINKITKNKSTCTAEYKKCFSRIIWPTRKSLELDK